jgi:hypothetical protein
MSGVFRPGYADHRPRARAADRAAYTVLPVGRMTGSWLGGPASAGLPADRAAGDYPGHALGLPRAGAGAVAGYGSRLLALLLDGVACVLIASLFGGFRWESQHYVNLAVLAVEYLVLLPVGGQTLGMRLVRIRVVPLQGGRLPLRWVVVRTLLLLVVIPALFSDRDQRGMHDRASGTVVVRV